MMSNIHNRLSYEYVIMFLAFDNDIREFWANASFKLGEKTKTKSIHVEHFLHFQSSRLSFVFKEENLKYSKFFCYDRKTVK